MVHFILLCAYISLVLVVVDTAVLSVANEPKGEVAKTDIGNYSYTTDRYFNKTRRPVNTINRINSDDSLKHGNTIQTDDSRWYKQRSKTAAVLISIYFGIFGVDWFYLSRGNSGYIVAGIFKLLISCGCCSGWPILTLGARRLSSVMIKTGYILNMLLSFISLLWWIIDWTRILANKFPDGNGKKLKHFSEYL